MLTVPSATALPRPFLCPKRSYGRNSTRIRFAAPLTRFYRTEHRTASFLIFLDSSPSVSARASLMAEGVDGVSYGRNLSGEQHHPHHGPLLCNPSTGHVSSADHDDYRTVLCGYPVHTRSDSCVSFIDEFYRQVSLCTLEYRLIEPCRDS